MLQILVKMKTNVYAGNTQVGKLFVFKGCGQEVKYKHYKGPLGAEMRVNYTIIPGNNVLFDISVICFSSQTKAVDCKGERIP